jgi:hypothetical protein
LVKSIGLIGNRNLMIIIVKIWDILITVQRILLRGSILRKDSDRDQKEDQVQRRKVVIKS